MLLYTLGTVSEEEVPTSLSFERPTPRTPSRPPVVSLGARRTMRRFGCRPRPRKNAPFDGNAHPNVRVGGGHRSLLEVERPEGERGG